MSDEIRELFLKSQLREDLLKKLSLDAVKVVSFDVFDTLLRRQCFQPKEIFIEVAKIAIKENIISGMDEYDYMNIRCQAEVKARELSSEEEIDFGEIFDQMYFTKEIQLKLKSIEIAVEKANLFLDPIAEQMLYEVQNYHKKIIITSDMYIGEASLKEIIAEKLPKNIKIEHIFVSSANKKTKTTGNQYRHIIKKISLSPENILHIGDNEQADVLSAKAAGLPSLLYNIPKWAEEVFIRERALLFKSSISIYHTRLFSSLLLPLGLTKLECFFYYYGCLIHGATLAGFCRWINANISNLGEHEVMCLMREGDIYAKCLNILFPHTPVSKFYASRKSTYLASLQQDDFLANLIPALARNSYTLNDLFQEFELGEVSSSLIKFKHVAIHKLESISVGNKLVIELVNEELTKFKELIKKKVSDNKQLLNQYFTQTKKTSFPHVFVDFGSRGNNTASIRAWFRFFC